jgi:hypothetical protein
MRYNRNPVRWDKVNYCLADYTGQEQWQETHRRIDEQCKRFGLTNFQEPTRVMCSYTPQGKIRDKLCPDCNFHPCSWVTNSNHIVHNVKSMRGGNGYKNNERHYLGYRVCYYVLHQGYSATNERIRLPDCMTQAIEKEWPNPPGEKYTRYNLRRHRRAYPVRLQIQPPQIRIQPVAAQSICRPRHIKIKIEKPLQEVIEIEDDK